MFIKQQWSWGFFQHNQGVLKIYEDKEQLPKYNVIYYILLCISITDVDLLLNFERRIIYMRILKEQLSSFV